MSSPPGQTHSAASECHSRGASTALNTEHHPHWGGNISQAQLLPSPYNVDISISEGISREKMVH